jgi:hypothetical protein
VTGDPERVGPDATLRISYELGMVNVEIIGPRSSAAVAASPRVARETAALLNAAADKAEAQMPKMEGRDYGVT